MIEVHGHRGSRGTHPENTLAAFEEAFNSGAQAMEIDTQPTEDGVVTVFHDFSLTERVCRRGGCSPFREMKVFETPWSEMKTWDVGSVPQPKFRSQTLSQQRILTLDEVLGWLTKKRPPFALNIEMKVWPQWKDPFVARYTANVLGLIEKYRAFTRVLLQSFDPRPLMQARKAMPRLPISLLFENKVDFVAQARRVGATHIGPSFEMLSDEEIIKAHNAKLKVIPYTVNDVKDWDRLIAWKVDGIITDFPRQLVKHIGNNERAPS